VIERRDGRRQWAYDGAALYTSVLDRRPGDLFGGDSYDQRGDAPAVREPITPAPDIPPGFGITTTWLGRLLHTARGFSVYASDADRRGRSNCDDDCARTWIPMQAPVAARAHGDWSIVERRDGVRQWAFRGKPLYRYAEDSRVKSLLGSDVPGWHNVYTQRAPEPPASFTVQPTSSGEVLADAAGRTIYTYFCGDDAPDQLGCDHPTETQAYRFTICGGGSPERCLANFPYVLAAPGERARSRMWRIVEIDPLKGHPAVPGQAGALRVWAFRDRPVYTFAGDTRPGETNADGLGEFQAERTGYRAIWLRDDFFRVGG
jgi:predicted lipoprotein with Yx(FWY)xxD motif